MKIMKSFLFLIALTIPTFAFAFFCPTNFELINFGDSLSTVLQKCGKPTSQKEVTKKEDNVPQEWDYFMKTSPVGSTALQQGTYKTSFVFDKSGKLINIASNNSAADSNAATTNICGGQVRLGMTKDEVKNVCGDPAFSMKSSGEDSGSATEIKLVELEYAGTPTVTLVFENGILKEKK